MDEAAALQTSLQMIITQFKQKHAIFDTTKQTNTDLLNDAKLINTSAVGWAAQAASILQRKTIKQKWETKPQKNTSTFNG